MPTRNSIKDFQLANAMYKGASVSFYTVADGEATSTLATLYEGLTGSQTLENPQTLDSRGKFKQPVYIEVPVVAVIDGIGFASHSTGVIHPYISDMGDLIDSTVAAVLAATQSIMVAVSDEDTPITSGTNKIRFRMPYAMTLASVRASLSTAQTSGSVVTVDINESGTTILSTKLTLDNAEKTSTTAATAAVISDTSLADDAEISIDIDQVGDGTAKGLKVYLIGTKT